MPLVEQRLIVVVKDNIMKVKIIILLFSSILNAQEVVFNETNCIKDYSGEIEEEFIVKIWENDTYNDLDIIYRKAKISYFGEFYIAKIGDVLFSSLGIVADNDVSLWLEDGTKEKMFDFNKKSQDLGYPFRGYHAYHNRKTSNGLHIYDIVKKDCSSEDDNIPYELIKILVFKGVIHQFVFRKKQTEQCFYTFRR